MASLRFWHHFVGTMLPQSLPFVAVGDKGVTKVSHGNRRPFGPKSGFLSLSGNSSSFSGLQPSYHGTDRSEKSSCGSDTSLLGCALLTIQAIAKSMRISDCKYNPLRPSKIILPRLHIQYITAQHSTALVLVGPAIYDRVPKRGEA